VLGWPRSIWPPRLFNNAADLGVLLAKEKCLKPSFDGRLPWHFKRI
jgi:hypothetical protein